MAIQPKNLSPTGRAQRKKYLSSTISTTPVSLRTTFNALGISASSFWFANDDGSAADLKFGDSASQPILLKAGGDAFLDSYGDDVWIVAASGTITFHAIAFGT